MQTITNICYNGKAQAAADAAATAREHHRPVLLARAFNGKP